MTLPDADQTPWFPQQVNSVSRVLRQLKKEDSGLFNCACSVSNDTKFVEEVCKLYPHLPVAPNLRCGLWYVRDGDPTCYFKSTDGHNGTWSFSTVRLNLHIAELAAARGGCIIVDATRRGKTFPDALTKTIPIWAAVLNRAVTQLRTYHDGNRREAEPDQADATFSPQDWDTALHLPSWISQNERIQIEAQLDQWVRDLVQVTGDVGCIAAVLDKPLRPIWLSQESRMWTNAMTDRDSLPFTPLYLVSASTPNPQRLSIDVGKGTMSYSYVPGAGDDEESWARGLTPALFWQHHQAILAAGPHGINGLVADLLQDHEEARGKATNGATSAATLGYVKSQGVVTNKHHPTPGGVEMSQTTLPAHGLFWIGSSRLALGPAAAAHPSFVWQHADAVVNASAPSRRELKASAAAEATRQGVAPASATAVRHCEAHASVDQGNCGATSVRQCEAISQADQGSPEAMFVHQCEATTVAEQGKPGAYLRVPIASSKMDRHGLERQLPAVLEFVSNKLAQEQRVLLHCDAGDDACVCLAVAIHLACFTSCSNETNVMRFVKTYNPSQHPPGTRLLTPAGNPVTKHSIRRVLAIVSRFHPLARPTRGMLKQVFNFFEPPHKLPVPAAAASPVAAMSAAAATADPAGAGGADVALAAVDTDAAFIPAGGSQAVQQSAQNTSAKYMQDLAENYLTTSCSSSGTTSLTYLTADSTTGAADVAVPNASLRAAPAVSPFVAIAEDTMQAGFVLPDLKAPVALDRGTKSI